MRLPSPHIPDLSSRRLYCRFSDRHLSFDTFPQAHFFFFTCATCLILKCSFQRLKKTSSVCLSTNVKLYGHYNRERSGFIIIISEIFLSSEKTALSGEDTQRKRKWRQIKGWWREFLYQRSRRSLGADAVLRARARVRKGWTLGLISLKRTKVEQKHTLLLHI